MYACTGGGGGGEKEKKKKGGGGVSTMSNSLKPNFKSMLIVVHCSWSVILKFVNRFIFSHKDQ